MRQLHPEAIAAIQSKALFSQAEEALLAKISSVSQTVLLSNTVFLWFRVTAVKGKMLCVSFLCSSRRVSPSLTCSRSFWVNTLESFTQLAHPRACWCTGSYWSSTTCWMTRVVGSVDFWFILTSRSTIAVHGQTVHTKFILYHESRSTQWSFPHLTRRMKRTIYIQTHFFTFCVRVYWHILIHSLSIYSFYS